MKEALLDILNAIMWVLLFPLLVLLFIFWVVPNAIIDIIRERRNELK